MKRPPPPGLDPFRVVLATGAALVVVAVWLVWSLLLAPPAETPGSLDPERGGVARAGREVERKADAPTEADAITPGAGSRKPLVPPLPAMPRPQLSVDELRRALVGDGAVPGEVLLIFRSAEELAAFRARAGLYGLRILDADARHLGARVAYTDLARLADELNEHPQAYENVAANLIARIPGLPREMPQLDLNNQGGLAPFDEGVFASIGAPKDRDGWGRAVKVAVLDSGIADHETLEGVKVERVKLVETGPVPNGHGTSMASLISGRVAPAEGVAPAAELLDIWVANEEGVSNTALVAQGIMEAVDRGAQVINISLGSFGSSLMLQNAVQYALNQRVLIVAAAGNEQMNQLAYPAAYPGVIAVGAVDAERRQAFFSNSGRGLTLAAPGVGILSAYPGGKVVVGSGTSQATALTTGTVAAVLGWGRSPGEVVKLLTQSAASTGASQEQVGAGFLQVPPRR